MAFIESLLPPGLLVEARAAPDDRAHQPIPPQWRREEEMERVQGIEHQNEYDDSMVAILGLVWGEGFMAPGGEGRRPAREATP
jgi:hypothetical protein